MSLESICWELELCSSSLAPDSPSEWSVQDYPSDDASGLGSPAIATAATVPSTARAHVAQQLLDQLEEYVKKQESFSNWFEEEKNSLQPLQIFDELQSISTTTLPLPASTELTSLTTVSLPSYIKDEVSCVLGNGHLTPPQSPPQGSLVPAPISYTTLGACESVYTEAYLPEGDVGDVAREMAVVEEVVRGVAQQWEHLEFTDSSSRSSRSSDSISIDESDGSEDDPEWQPCAETMATTSRPASSAPRRNARTRPYNPQDRRQRKKEQNKNAATRYRIKKKAQVCTIVDEQRDLAEKSTTLRSKVTDIEKEISYLKNLMREMFRAKGLVK